MLSQTDIHSVTPTLATLARPAGMPDRTWTGATWVENTPSTTFFTCADGRVWLLTGGHCGEWRVLSTAAARAEWKRLTAAGYTRSDRHVCDVVAVACGDASKVVIDDDWSHYRAGHAEGGFRPVIRHKRCDRWSVLYDTTVTTDDTGVRKVGSKCVHTESIYNWNIATAIVNDTDYAGNMFQCLADDVRVERRNVSGRHVWYVR